MISIIFVEVISADSEIKLIRTGIISVRSNICSIYTRICHSGEVKQNLDSKMAITFIFLNSTDYKRKTTRVLLTSA